MKSKLSPHFQFIDMGISLGIRVYELLYSEHIVIREKNHLIQKILFLSVLCSNRLSQMTRTYDDIEAVTRLLEEKEKDLELTAHIGKDLLTENTRLKKQVEELENDVKLANENCIQLKYELSTKSHLLAALTNDDETVVNDDDESMSIFRTLFLLNIEIKSKNIFQFLCLMNI